LGCSLAASGFVASFDAEGFSFTGTSSCIKAEVPGAKESDKELTVDNAISNTLSTLLRRVSFELVTVYMHLVNVYRREKKFYIPLKSNEFSHSLHPIVLEALVRPLALAPLPVGRQKAGATRPFQSEIPGTSQFSVFGQEQHHLPQNLRVGEHGSGNVGWK
jgi:hypothetical protein